MKIIAFGTMKGGTGKTTLAFNLAGLLAETHKVLLWDLDPQCNLSQSAGMDIDTRDVATTKNIFDDPKTKPQRVTICLEDNLWIMPGSIDLTVTEAVLQGRSARESILRYYIEDNIDFFDQFDYILLDTNPSMGNININGFVVADSIVLVSDVSMHSVRGAELFQFLWRGIRGGMRLQDNVKALVLNNYDSRTKIAGTVKDYCEEQDHLNGLLIQTVIPSRVSMKQTAIEHTPINRLRPNGEMTRIFRKVLEQLEEKEVF